MKKAGKKNLPKGTSKPSAEPMTAIRRGVVDLVSEEALQKKLERTQADKKPLRVKLGVDPSSPDLHLGHSIPLWKLRTFQDLGHKAVLIIGDGTGRIGDPTGRNKTRPQLSLAEVEANSRTYLEQAGKILVMDDPERLEIVRNGDWFRKMDFFDTMKLASRLSVARILERDYFAERFKSGVEIRIHELFYPLMQGWDSVMVHADVELGGTDQLFNLLVGRILQEQEGQEPQVCLTLPLIEGTDGRKMSKSYDNAIGIADPPGEMFGKCMALADELMEKYFLLVTRIPEREVAAILGGHPREAKARLAREIVTLFHGAEAARASSEEFDRIFKERQKPQEIPSFSSPRKINVLDLLVRCRFAKSKSDARRLIQQGGVRLDDARIEKESVLQIPSKGMLIQVGKRRFGRVLPDKT